MTLTIIDRTRSTSWNVSISFHLIPFDYGDYGKGFASLLSLLDFSYFPNTYLTCDQLQFFLPRKKRSVEGCFPVPNLCPTSVGAARRTFLGALWASTAGAKPKLRNLGSKRRKRKP